MSKADLESMNLNWNYRILKVTDEVTTYYKIISVYYNNEGICRWVDYTNNILIAPTIDDLKGTTEYVLLAFQKPILVLREDGKLREEGKTIKKLSAEDIVDEIESMENGERIRCLSMLFDKYFDTRPPREVLDRELYENDSW